MIGATLPAAGSEENENPRRSNACKQFSGRCEAAEYLSGICSFPFRRILSITARAVARIDCNLPGVSAHLILYR
jgi:hypothetical protein